MIEPQLEIRAIAAEETWELRRSVMWPDKDVDFVKLPDDADGIHYGGFIAGELVAVVSLFINGKQAQFRKFATATKLQRCGYGSELLEHLLQEAPRLGVTSICCDARVEKADFYRRFGLAIAGEPFCRNGKEYVRMVKILR